MKSLFSLFVTWGHHEPEEGKTPRSRDLHHKLIFF